MLGWEFLAIFLVSAGNKFSTGRKGMNRSTTILAIVLAPFLALDERARAEDYVRYSAPDMFTYEELVALSEDTELDPALAAKLERITTTPFLSNEAYYLGAKPHVPDVAGLGRSMNVVFWNIERGIHLDEIKLLFTDRDAFLLKASAGDTDIAGLRADIDTLQSADVILLNEVDWGMRRSGYREVIRELGQALNMNWVYGVEFVEIDPALLGLETFEDVEDPQARQELLDEFSVDKDKLRGLHGTAILSRYPIREAKTVPFKFRAYDWFGQEKGLRPAEKGIRAGARIIGEDLNREMRRGGRTQVLAHLDVPHLEEKRLTVVSPHLENRTKPANRRRQMKEVLELVQDAHHPVIIAGDFNTTGGDSESFAIEKHVYKKVTDGEFWVHKGVKAATGVGLVYDVLRFGFKFTKNVNDPTVAHVPYLSPNKESRFFSEIEKFRFADGTVFDFRGDAKHSSNGASGTLANSNQRAGKGFAHTYEFVITVGVLGQYKLDWFFVKSYLEEPRNVSGPYVFAPHFARTMINVNQALEKDLSDHNPMTITLPFGEPVNKGGGR